MDDGSSVLYVNNAERNNNRYNTYLPELNEYISTYISEEVDIRWAKILKITPSTLRSRVIAIARNIVTSHIASNAVYVVSELKYS